MSSPLRTEHLCKIFRHVDALRDLTIEAPEGSVFALVGPNGAGKTTAMKTLLNIHQPTSGRAEVLGVDSRLLGAEQFARIGYVSENQQMPGWMKVGYFLSYCREFYPDWREQDAAELVRLFQLPLDRKLRHLSRGMRVKAALASSLAYRPKLILLDEPFSGLDVLVREQLIESVLERTPEATVFLSSHDLGEIESFASHIAYLHEGRLLFSEEMASLSARFREVEVTLGESADLSHDSLNDSSTDLPNDLSHDLSNDLSSDLSNDWLDNLPATWLNPEQSGVVARFVDSQFDSERHRAGMQRFFPGARAVTVRAVPLRTIILAVSKAAQPATHSRQRRAVTPCI
jgi:ABC-2 type transport system ATP-binding protein